MIVYIVGSAQPNELLGAADGGVASWLEQFISEVYNGSIAVDKQQLPTSVGITDP